MICRRARFSRSRAFNRSATSLGTPARTPLSRSNLFHPLIERLRRAAEFPKLSRKQPPNARRVRPRDPKPSRTARPRTSEENLFLVLLIMAPLSQELEPPPNRRGSPATIGRRHPTIATMQILEPSNSWSDRKSIDQLSQPLTPSASIPSPGLIGRRKPAALVPRCPNEQRPKTEPAGDNGPHNLAVLRHMALNVLRKDPRKESLRAKFKIAAWNNDYLLSLLDKF